MILSEYLPNLEGYLPNEFLRAFVVFVVVLLVTRILLLIIQRVSIKLTEKTKTDIDDIIIARTSKPLTYLSILVAFLLSFNEIYFADQVSTVITRIVLSIMIINLGYIVFVIIDVALLRVWKKMAKNTETDLDDTLVSLVHSTIKGAFIVLIALYILSLWGIEIGPLLAGLGIAGLAVALALQPTLSNIFSGVGLILDKTFKVGDVIRIDSGELGTVHHIGLRTTRIVTFDNEMIIIPNSKLADMKLENFFQPDLRVRVNVEFSTEYGVDPEYVKLIAIEEIEKINTIDKSQEVRVLFTSMGDNALLFKAMFWVDDIAKKWPAHQEAMSRLYRRLYKEDIGIPFPQRTIWLNNEKSKPKSPSDKKFKKVQGKYYANFGHEYKEESKEEVKKQEVPKKKKKFLNLKIKGFSKRNKEN